MIKEIINKLKEVPKKSNDEWNYINLNEDDED